MSECCDVANTGGAMRSGVCPTRVQSLCPVCGRVTAAEYVRRDGDGAVYFEIVCPEHGVFSTLASEDPAAFDDYMSRTSVTVAPREALTKGVGSGVADGAEAGAAPAGGSECPLHCGVCTDHLMTACCVLIDVTARCDQHCPWCFARADEETSNSATATEPSLEEIGRWLDRIIELGEERPFNLQISGGEPAVRDDLPEIVALARSRGFTYVQLNTNGRRLAGACGDSDDPLYGTGAGGAYAQRLADAGLSVVYLQFDGVTDGVYEALRGSPLLDIKLRAIENCARASLPVTLVPTIVKGVNDTNEIGALMDFLLANLGVVKGIHFQPASFFGRTPCAATTEGAMTTGGHERTTLNPDRVTMFDVMDEIERQTDGRIKKSDLVPITTGHPLCCFCANFLRERDGTLTSMMSAQQKENGASCCDATPPPGSHAQEPTAPDCCCAPAPDPLEIVRRDRDFVLNKWTVGVPAAKQVGVPDKNPDGAPPAPKDPDAPMSLEEALEWFRGNMFTISGMAFMDRSNLDAERLKRCRVQYYTPDDRLIPFCAYNTLYRGAL
jgi:uncharacterized radical SAM superfamily Fe-S cluster-containing enzyme